MNDLLHNFSSLSLDYNKQIDKKDRQLNGIFFTPKTARTKLLNVIKNYNKKFDLILEPSFGSGEFINDIQIDDEIIYKKIIGVEKHKQLYKSIETKDYLETFNIDFLDFQYPNKFNLIIGNPPYYITNIKNKHCMTGKGNIFALFLYKSIKEHLDKNGILAFVLPTSLYNSSCYQLCREYIINNTTILHLEDINVKYFDTTQKTMIMILQLQKNENNNFIFKDNYLSPNYIRLNELIQHSTTLKDLDLRVKTGEVTWNENKDKLSKNGTLIIYANNIKNGKLHLVDKLKDKQYIQNFDKQSNKGNFILLPRGYGNSYKFEYILLDNTTEFYGENHVNIIYSRNNDKEIFKKIIKSFENPKTLEFIKLFVGNGALSKNEIENLLPIYI